MKKILIGIMFVLGSYLLSGCQYLNYFSETTVNPDENVDPVPIVEETDYEADMIEYLNLFLETYDNQQEINYRASVYFDILVDDMVAGHVELRDSYSYDSTYPYFHSSSSINNPSMSLTTLLDGRSGDLFEYVIQDRDLFVAGKYELSDMQERIDFYDISLGFDLSEEYTKVVEVTEGVYTTVINKTDYSNYIIEGFDYIGEDIVVPNQVLMEYRFDVEDNSQIEINYIVEHMYITIDGIRYEMVATVEEVYEVKPVEYMIDPFSGYNFYLPFDVEHVVPVTNYGVLNIQGYLLADTPGYAALTFMKGTYTLDLSDWHPLDYRAFDGEGNEVILTETMVFTQEETIYFEFEYTMNTSIDLMFIKEN
jgi:hypothetical protein